MFTMLKGEKGVFWNDIKGSQLFIFSSMIIYQSILGNYLKWVEVCNLLPVGAGISTMKQEKLYIWYIIQGWNRVGRRERNFLHTVRRAGFSSSEDTDCVMLMCWGFHGLETCQLLFREKIASRMALFWAWHQGTPTVGSRMAPSLCLIRAGSSTAQQYFMACSYKQPQVGKGVCKMQK